MEELLPEKYLLQYIIKKSKKKNPTWSDINEIKQHVEGMFNKDDDKSLEYFYELLEKLKYNYDKIGVMVAFVHPEHSELMTVGYSLCNLSAKDKFDHTMMQLSSNEALYTVAGGFGKHVAIGRAMKWGIPNELNKLNMVIDKISNTVPHSIKNQLTDFIHRSQRYYKDKNLPEWINLFLNK